MSDGNEFRDWVHASYKQMFEAETNNKPVDYLLLSLINIEEYNKWKVLYQHFLDRD